MKKSILFVLFFLTTLSGLAQKIRDSITVSIDTVNITGKVVDEKGNPVIGATILSETFDKNYNYIRTMTNNNGYFKLSGISPKDIIRIRKDDVAIEHNLKGSRYLFIKVPPLSKKELNANLTPFYINAKRISAKEKYVFKRIDSAVYIGWHPFGHYSSANYPGGMQKFYDFIQKGILYPKAAIQNNIEGVVKIEFTVDRQGNCIDFLIVSDIGYGCAAEVLKVIKSSKKWNPAMNGLFVNQRISIEVPFKLTD